MWTGKRYMLYKEIFIAAAAGCRGAACKEEHERGGVQAAPEDEAIGGGGAGGGEADSRQAEGGQDQGNEGSRATETKGNHGKFYCPFFFSFVGNASCS